jgi:predicted phosphate transport protein (TIGR00153 family)
MAFSFLPREDDYFVFFSQMTERIQEAADILGEMVQSNSQDFGDYARRIKDVEHACDQIAHNITNKLNKSFITPFDREDIYTLSVALDDICDYIDAGARAIVMYDIREFNDPIRQFVEIIRGLAAEINMAVSALKASNGMNKHFVEIHRLENEADEVYFRAIKELFTRVDDPVSVIKLKEFYEILENATDRCESVANIIESIVLKHT